VGFTVRPRRARTANSSHYLRAAASVAPSNVNLMADEEAFVWVGRKLAENGSANDIRPVTPPLPWQQWQRSAFAEVRSAVRYADGFRSTMLPG
jgi:hypothetical protein